jgi:hypothetical protein
VLYEAHGEEGEVASDHVIWHVGALDWRVGVGAKSTKILQEEVLGGDESVAVAEHVHADSILHNVCLRIGVQISEVNRVLAKEVEAVHVLEVSGSEEEPVVVEEGVRVLSVDDQLHFTNIAYCRRQSGRRRR